MPGIMLPLGDVKAQKPRFTIERWVDVLRDRNRLEWLLFVGEYYRDLFDRSLKTFFKLADSHKIGYLVDFDVLRTYLEGDYRRKDTFLVASLFHYTTQPYAIPAGAFEELLSYLRASARLQPIAKFGSKSMGQDAAVRTVARWLDIPDYSTSSLSENTAAIIDVLDSGALRLSRLARFLMNPGFAGVLVNYDRTIYSRLLKVVGRLPRREAEERTLRDQRDTKNLAIALQSLSGAAQDDKKTAYYLITLTSSLLDIPIHVREMVHDPNEAIVSDLRSLLKALKPDDSNRIGAPFDLPVVHPREAASAELTGFFQDPHAAYADVRERIRELDEINAFVTDELARSTRMKGAGVASGDAYFEEVRKKTAMLLDRFGRRFLADDERGLYWLEDMRATELTVNAPPNSALAGILGDESESLAMASTRFLRIASEVEAGIVTHGSIDFLCRVSVPNSGCFYEAVSLIQCLGDWQEEEEKRCTSVISGEMYLSRGITLHEPCYAYYALRWPIHCPLEACADAIEQHVLPLADILQPFSGALRTIDDDSACWSAGFVATVRDRCFGSTWKNTEGRRATGVSFDSYVDHCFNLTRIKSTFMGRPALIPLSTVAEQARLNTPIGDFVFDIFPMEDDVRRYFTVISHLNLAKLIASLYSDLSPFFSPPNQIGENLDRILEPRFGPDPFT